MNYGDYIRALDSALYEMTKEELSQWIFNIGRKKSKSAREEFLSSLIVDSGSNSIEYDKKSWDEWIMGLKKGEIFFEIEINDEDYFEDNLKLCVPEDLYKRMDTYNIRERMVEGFGIARQWTLEGKYKFAFDLYTLLFNLRFFVCDKVSENKNNFSLKKICNDSYLSFNYELLVLEYLYLIYQSTEGEVRASEIYDFVNKQFENDFEIEDLFIVGPVPLEGIDRFLNEWISFLIKIESNIASEYIIEACLYLDGINYLYEIARIHYRKHPLLFHYICEHYYHRGENQMCETIGVEAIALIPIHYVVRSEIADMAARAANVLKHNEMSQYFYFESFYSHSTFNNYFRLFNSNHSEELSETLTQYVKTLPIKEKLDHCVLSEEEKLNSITEEELNVIRFFNGEFESLFNEYKKEVMTLDWSSNFIGILIPLFILLLNCEEELSTISHSVIYEIVTQIDRCNTFLVRFQDSFIHWKNNQTLTQIQEEAYLEWVLTEIEKRTDAILETEDKVNYHKVILMITSMAETLQSRVVKDGEYKYLENYKIHYSRFSAFKDEVIKVLY